MYLEVNSYNRFFYDFMYCLLLKFTLWNVVRGINVDTFSELRAMKMERLEDTTEVCFMCGIDKLTFDRNDMDHGFMKHIRRDHNMWNYLYFFIYLWEQDKDDDDGLELYVRKCIEDNDISWFPIGRALVLNQDDGDEIEELAGQVNEDIINMNKSILSKIGQLEDNIGNKVLNIDNVLNDNASVSSHQTEMSKTMSAFQRLATRAPSMKKLGGGEGNNSLIRSQTVDLREYEANHSNQVLLEPVELEGINSIFDHRQHGKVSCRIVSKVGMYDIPRSMHKDGIHIKFDPSEVCVCTSLHPGLNLQTEKVKVQVFVEEFGSVKKFVGAVDISFEELTSAATVRLQKSFIANFGGKSVEGRFVCLAFTMLPPNADFKPGTSLSADLGIELNTTSATTSHLHKSASSVM